MYTVELENGEIYTVLHMVKSAGTSIHNALIRANKKIHVNQRHAHIRNLPQQYKKYPKIIVIRKPHEWYESFYKFFLSVQGYLSFMLNDPKNPPDGYIYPIGLNEFIRRSLDFKGTLLRFPNKARVFNNLLRSQAHLHFITSYFESAIDPTKPETYDQFSGTLYRWFWKNVGGEEAIFIPMDRLDVVEDLLKIKIQRDNVTQRQMNESIDMKVFRDLRRSHKEFYDMIAQFDDSNLRTYSEWLQWRREQDAK